MLRLSLPTAAAAASAPLFLSLLIEFASRGGGGGGEEGEEGENEKNSVKLFSCKKNENRKLKMAGE